jgi:hypothetical protein
LIAFASPYVTPPITAKRTLASSYPANNQRSTNTEHYLSYLRSLNDRITYTKVDLTPEKRALLTLTMSLPSEVETSLQPTPPTFDEASRQLIEHQRRYNQDQAVSRLSLSHLAMSSPTYSYAEDAGNSFGAPPYHL